MSTGGIRDTLRSAVTENLGLKLLSLGFALGLYAFIHGAENACFLPRSTEETVAALSQANGAGLYKRHVIPDYGHIDCIFGKHAARDVYPHILEHLEATR